MHEPSVNAACLVAGGVLLAVAMSIQGAGFMKVAILAVGFVLPMMTFVLGPAIVSEVAPIGQRGTALLVTYSIITISGLISPVVMGFSLQAAGPGNVGAGYSQAFIITFCRAHLHRGARLLPSGSGSLETSLRQYACSQRRIRKPRAPVRRNQALQLEISDVG